MMSPLSQRLEVPRRVGECSRCRELIHEWFESHTFRAPEKVAVRFEGQSLTYGELNLRANRLAHHLRDLGVSPGVVVGLCAERAIEMVIGILGILKAGGAYLPIDPTYPSQRQAYLLSDANVPFLLTQRNLVERLPDHKARIVFLGETAEHPA